MHRNPLLLAIDLGTSSAKVGLFQPDGVLVAFHRQPYPTSRPAPGWVEQDPNEWWQAVSDGLRATLTNQQADRIAAVAVCGQGPTLVLVDSAGEPTRPAISWMDTRSAALMAQLDGGDAYSPVPRLAWVTQHEPATLARTRWALQAWDFIGHRLTGGTAAAATTSAGHTVWGDRALATLGLTGSPVVPPTIAAGTAYGTTAGPWAEAAGLPSGIPVVAGLNDGVAAIIGANGAVLGRATDPGGSSGGLALCTDRLLTAPGIQAWPGLDPDTWFVGGALAAGGRAADWWATMTGTSVADLLASAEQAPSGSGGVLMLPFLEGERAPLWDSELRGAFLGLTISHGPPELARGVIEGTAYALRLLIEAVAAAGGSFHELRLSGRQAESRLWSQVKADVTGLIVGVPAVAESSLVCSAICAAVGAGLYPNLAHAAEGMVTIAYTLDPNPTTRHLYEDGFDRYRRAITDLKGLRA